MNRRRTLGNRRLRGTKPPSAIRSVPDRAPRAPRDTAQLWRNLRVLARYAALMAVAAGAVVSVAAAWRYMRGSEHFEVRQLEVKGAHVVREADILALAGVRQGMSSLEVDEDAAAEAVRTHPWIRDAVVELNLPDRVHVLVTERKPAALVALDRLYLADASGAIFKPVEVDDPVEGLLLVTGFAPDALAVPGGQERVERIAADALNLREEIGRHPLANALRLGEIHWDAAFGWRLVTADPVQEIQLGVGDLADKLTRVMDVQATLPEGAVAVVMRADNHRSRGRVTVELEYPGGGVRR